MTPSDVGKAFSGLRRREEKVCEVCERPYTGLLAQTVCSSKCRERKRYLRRTNRWPIKD